MSHSIGLTNPNIILIRYHDCITRIWDHNDANLFYTYIYMCVCMYIYIYMQKCICIYIYTYILVYVFIHFFIYCRYLLRPLQ